MAKQNQLVRLPGIESRIYLLRGLKVMFDADLAELYGVETKALNRAVKPEIRNKNGERTPPACEFGRRARTFFIHYSRIFQCDKVCRTMFSARRRKPHAGGACSRELAIASESDFGIRVKRNRERFPEDFMFQLERQEVANLRFQLGTSSLHGGRRFLPNFFTQEGIAMLSGVLRSERAIAVNIEIMRTFVRLRNFLASQRELARKLARSQRKVGSHDEEIQAIFQVLKRLMTPPRKRRREIGFHVKN